MISVKLKLIIRSSGEKYITSGRISQPITFITLHPHISHINNRSGITHFFAVVDNRRINCSEWCRSILQSKNITEADGPSKRSIFHQKNMTDFSRKILRTTKQLQCLYHITHSFITISRVNLAIPQLTRLFHPFLSPRHTPYLSQ